MGGFNSKDRIFRQDGGVSDNWGGGLQGPYQNRSPRAYGPYYGVESKDKGLGFRV